jgi:fructose-1,6-bisphosphatase II
VAYGRHNAISVLAAAEDGNILHAPDTYMEKIAVGPEAKDVIDLCDSVEANLHRIAQAKNFDVSDLTVVVLDRERHKDLIAQIRKVGARIHLILDGDVLKAGEDPKPFLSPAGCLFFHGVHTPFCLLSAT